ncbi:ribose 1,5-bisphosphokinase [Erwinia psidii]|uniref:Ribose 1,5-bisphosphate phosphokinase PhnN n=1 Tax=Erwinia psidii TaxID=69224 RepID=A0A3N6SHU4_9GAMM|nr:ribose 1,5-bisphosphokinase [Erwinia psidii]MCX8957670.1 ribose 1,5-bisphosphokinase [Erwinia psidii]MCX8960725.1 ribose 1,5-bisphosphokinase [Erwinia psidii]MCX8964029.1 ribose 1,5-bisphosphokinase [Erwinia psidii]RQM39513.1 ribose 1,5-bisphosphokinase [Erwinia psidii]
MARLIYLIGASGCGKDSLLRALRVSPGVNMLVAHRYITRPAAPGDENHIALSEREFRFRDHHGLFCLSWQAHQLHYGLGIEVDAWLAKNIDVAINGSRAYLSQATKRYGDRLLPVCLTVPQPVLQQRLIARGRENEQQIAERLRRMHDYQETVPATCPRLHNAGPLAQTVRAFWQLLASAETSRLAGS